ncbi:hypothetical protein SAMN05192583_3050 [Sphingomonas gellani]|uniref:Inner membrane protein n=2 Tax=Sphingomonas gellani TaxID=1166340 RepID=A0A1H8HH26_9SPHN|nr:hypothetical protein SAMN05192583_3050 [Sphingomonas gellani]
MLLLAAFAAGLLTARFALTRLPWLAGEQRSGDVQPASTSVTAPASHLAQAAHVAGSTTAASTIDPDTLDTREAALAAQLASLEARTATLAADAGAAGGQATRAEAALVAFAARRAVDRGLGLGYLEGQLRTRFGVSEPDATEQVIGAARQPLTLEDLRQGLDAIAGDLATGTRGDGWFAGLRRELSGLVTLRKVGTPSPLPADRLARARRLIEAGQVEAARAEVSRMPGASEARNWLGAADRYIATRRALDRLEGAAITGRTVAA